MSKRARSSTVANANHSLPLELWVIIVSYCRPQEQWLVISKRWHRIAQELLYQRQKKWIPLAWKVEQSLCPRVWDFPLCVANLPYMESPTDMALSAHSLFQADPRTKGKNLSRQFTLCLFQLSVIRKKIVEISPHKSDCWRLAKLYLLLLHGDTYWLLSKKQYKSVLLHWGNVRLTGSTNLARVGRLDRRPLHYIDAYRVQLPVSKRVIESVVQIEPPELTIMMATSWHAFIVCDAEKEVLLNFLNCRYSMVEQQRKIGLELQTLLQ